MLRCRPVLLAALAGALAATAGADVCKVPSASYPTLGAPVRAGSCTSVIVAAGSFPAHFTIARDLAVQGAGSAATLLQVYFFVSGAGNDVTLNGLLVDGTAAGVAHFAHLGGMLGGYLLIRYWRTPRGPRTRR
mgnify:CR=1 FL=1